MAWLGKRFFFIRKSWNSDKNWFTVSLFFTDGGGLYMPKNPKQLVIGLRYFTCNFNAFERYIYDSFFDRFICRVSLEIMIMPPPSRFFLLRETYE